ncbi:hypothetical protein SRIMM317S_04749 [Streptomyces rimosus subsp. rimosus]
MAAAVQGAREVLGAARVRQLPGGGLAGLLRDGVPPGTVNLAVGTPAFPDTPPELVDAACAALRAGVHHSRTRPVSRPCASGSPPGCRRPPTRTPRSP